MVPVASVLARRLVAGLSLLYLCCTVVPTSSAAQSRPELIEIFEAARRLAEPEIVDGIPDYGPAAVAEQRRQLRALQLGFYDDRPRSRELIYNFLRPRALRVIVDVEMALGRMTVDEAIAALMSVPMDRRIAREEAEDFFAAPTGGLVYLVGKLQIADLLRDQRRVLGAAFDLRAFHDRLVEAAWVPLALTRAELLGDSALVQAMLQDERPLPLPEQIAQ